MRKWERQREDIENIDEPGKVNFKQPKMPNALMRLYILNVFKIYIH